MERGGGGMKDIYTFQSRMDYARRFGDAVAVGTMEHGTTIWAWRDGFWRVAELSGASTFYKAYRAKVSDVATWREGKTVDQAIARVAEVLGAA